MSARERVCVRACVCKCAELLVDKRSARKTLSFGGR